ncbi:MAG: hypothetical protein WBO36_01135, partial [Saprospiraceae bacterium]
LVKWLKSSKHHFLSTMAYNDSIVTLDGKHIVSPTGGTWYRSKMMKNFLSTYFDITEKNNDSLLTYTSRQKNVEIILKTNPHKHIFHTALVARNGFIHSILSGTKYAQKVYTYYGKNAYTPYIADTVIVPIRRLNIPQRASDAESGSDFMRRIAFLPLAEREEEIYKALAVGNLPDFLRQTTTLQATFYDALGSSHELIYEVMPDYLSVGNDKDFCRIPMNPHTAQRLADAYGASLITAKISDHIYSVADKKLPPVAYMPVGNINEKVNTFIDHHHEIEKQKAELGGKNGDLIAGIKKDIILSARIATAPNKVVIYGWHKPDGKPIQPVYSGHVDWYVDYSHGIRLVNNQVLLDGKPILMTDLLGDPILYKVCSDEDTPMTQTTYNH